MYRTVMHISLVRYYVCVLLFFSSSRCFWLHSHSRKTAARQLYYCQIVKLKHVESLDNQVTHDSVVGFSVGRLQANNA